MCLCFSYYVSAIIDSESNFTGIVKGFYVLKSIWEMFKTLNNLTNKLKERKKERKKEREEKRREEKRREEKRREEKRREEKRREEKRNVLISIYKRNIL